MNALWLKRLSDYIHSELVLATSQNILTHKLARQHALLKRYRLGGDASVSVFTTKNLPALLLHEARFAHLYWQNIRKLLLNKVTFPARKPHAADPMNKLLDIGYRYLANQVSIQLGKHDLDQSLGLFHRANTSDSQPLTYDLMELFRADLVDTEIVHYFKQQKQLITTLTAHDIAHVLHRIKHRGLRRHYLKVFKACRSYNYYMELQILHFSRAVRHITIFIPDNLPNRHDDRCNAGSTLDKPPNKS